MKKVLLIFLTIYSIAMANSNIQFVGDIKSYKQQDNRIEFVLDNALFNVYVVDNNIIRFRYTDKKEFSSAPSYAIIYNGGKNINFGGQRLDPPTLAPPPTTKTLSASENMEPFGISINP